MTSAFTRLSRWFDPSIAHSQVRPQSSETPDHGPTPGLLVVAPEETSLVPALEEVVELEAVAVAAMAAVSAEEPTVMMSTAQHAREAVGRDAAQNSLR